MARLKRRKLTKYCSNNNHRDVEYIIQFQTDKIYNEFQKEKNLWHEVIKKIPEEKTNKIK
jgi:hypothetical protein